MLNYKFKKNLFLLKKRVMKTKIRAEGIRCADHATLLYQQKFALTSSTGCGLLVDIVRIRTKTTDFFLF
jgi:hypothetical protein